MTIRDVPTERLIEMLQATEQSRNPDPYALRVMRAELARREAMAGRFAVAQERGQDAR
jgi:hypothetical protein